MTQSPNDPVSIGTADSTQYNRSRSIFAQLLATTIKNFLLFDLGLCYGLPTIVIPALTKIHNEHNRDEFLFITPFQASWLGAMGYLIQPIGSLLSTFLTDPLGRKKSMILVNIPFAMGWLILCQADSVWMVFVGFSLQGLAIGLMEAPVLTYLGEICEPSTRGVLMGYTIICHTIGIFTTFFLNTLMPWRTVATICLGMPVITAIAICFIPETPQWLLSKGRTEDAENSLCWLRGWVPKQIVTNEFQSMQRQCERSTSCNLCIKKSQKCGHPPPTLLQKYAELMRKRALKPFVIVMLLFFLADFSGSLSMKPFIVQIFKAYESPIAPDRAAAVMSFLDNVANLTYMSLVRFTGKRRLYLTVISGVFLCSLVISCYGFIYLPSGIVSFHQSNETQPISQLGNKNLSYIPLICLWLWSYFSYCGFIAMPWVLLGELFSFKSRGVASSLAAALNYFMGFITKKTYYNLETTLSMPGVSLLYCFICGIGLIVMYLILPETEDRSLEDIELHFSDNSKTITDRKIAKLNISTGNHTQMKDVEKCQYPNGNSKMGVDNTAFTTECSKV